MSSAFRAAKRVRSRRAPRRAAPLDGYSAKDLVRSVLGVLSLCVHGQRRELSVAVVGNPSLNQVASASRQLRRPLARQRSRRIATDRAGSGDGRSNTTCSNGADYLAGTLDERRRDEVRVCGAKTEYAAAVVAKDLLEGKHHRLLTVSISLQESSPPLDGSAALHAPSGLEVVALGDVIGVDVQGRKSLSEKVADRALPSARGPDQHNFGPPMPPARSGLVAAPCFTGHHGHRMIAGSPCGKSTL